MRIAHALSGLVLAACTQSPGTSDFTVEDATLNLFADQPFDTGPVTILTAEHGDLHSYTLVLCRDGQMICAGSARGHAGHYEVTDTHLVVSGAYAGRSFYLTPGGGGFMRRGGQDYPLAWDDESPPNVLSVTRNWSANDRPS